jgi:RecG-like helicase
MKIIFRLNLPMHKKGFKEIRMDMKKPVQMNRLLQVM